LFSEDLGFLGFFERGFFEGLGLKILSESVIEIEIEIEMKVESESERDVLGKSLFW
jgi:hypothetical protein